MFETYEIFYAFASDVRKEINNTKRNLTSRLLNQMYTFAEIYQGVSMPKLNLSGCMSLNNNRFFNAMELKERTSNCSGSFLLLKT